MRLGHGHRRTVVILWMWTAVLCGFVLVPLFRPSFNFAIPFGVAVLMIALFTWFSPLLARWTGQVDRSPVEESVDR